MRMRVTIVAIIAALTVVMSGVGGAHPSPPETPSSNMSQADLEEMLGPIALYPDNLLANVLAASVYPDEILAANKHVKSRKPESEIEKQPWEPPIKSIAKVPEVLEFLADNIDWTTAVGEVYLAQSKDVMTAVQSLRAKAKKSGALQSSEEMTVVESGSTVIIEQAQPDVVYVPQYNPQVVYVDDDDDLDGAIVGGVIGFGAGLVVGEIFDDCWDCDWHGGCVGWGEVDIDREFNMEGDINIGSGNTIERGDRTNNIQGGDRTNIRGGERTNNIGREGQRWEPNQSKVADRQARTGGRRASDDFRGASQRPAARAKVPNKTSAATRREPAKSLNSNNRKPAVSNSKAGNRGSSGGRREAPKPAAKMPPSRKPKTPAAAPKPRPKTPSASPRPKAPKQSKPSGFSPNRGSSKASSRGASSRSGGTRSSGARGGGSRGGGGRGGGRR